MPPDPDRRNLLATAVPLAAAAAALMLAASGDALAPAGVLGPPALFFGFLLLMALCALHRPLSGASLGLGTALLPSAIIVSGAVPAALAGGIALLLADLGHRLLRRLGSNPYPERRRLHRSFEIAAGGALACLGAGSAWTLIGPPTPLDLHDFRLYDAITASSAAYLLLFTGLRYFDQKLRRPEERVAALVVIQPLLLDLLGLMVGAALAVVVSNLGLDVAAALAVGLTLLALEALRNSQLLQLSEQRIYDLEKVTGASRRMIETGRELVSMVEQLRGECREVVQFLWFQLELEEVDGEPASWYAGPDGVLHEGVPEPDQAPPTLPGVHRRTGWKQLDYALAAEGRSLGRLRLWCDPRRVEPGAVDLFETLLPQLAATVHRALLDREAKRDPLTGIPARRELERRLEEVYRGCLDDGGSMAVVMCDLDHFKRINDTYGHTAGDHALIAVAKLLSVNVRQPDVCCRYGGEEFVLLLDNCDGGDALALAERLRASVADLGLVVADDRIPLTMSAGVAAFPELHVKRPDDLLLLADSALYEAKRRGRDRCLLHRGRGRYRTVGGSVVSGAEAREDRPPLPILFA